MFALHKVIAEIQRLQATSYALQPVEPMQRFLLSPGVVLTEAQLWTQSKKCEPSSEVSDYILPSPVLFADPCSLLRHLTRPLPLSPTWFTSPPRAAAVPPSRPLAQTNCGPALCFVKPPTPLSSSRFRLRQAALAT
jgi:hypothetical protein